MGETNLGRIGQLVPLSKRSFFFVAVVTCNEVKLRVVYVLSLSFNVITHSAMFVFPVLCAFLKL